MCVGGQPRWICQKGSGVPEASHYDYKNLLGSMMRKFSWMLLVVLAFSVYADDEKAVVVGSAEELRGITMDSGLWPLVKI